MTADPIAEPVQLADGLASMAELLGNPAFVASAVSLKETRATGKAISRDAHRYFSTEGIRIPPAIKLTFEPHADAISGCVLYSESPDGSLHGVCFVLDGNGIRFTTW